LNQALVELQLNPSSICLVTDIGCVGLADSLFGSIHTVHTTHGRSSAFATGIEVADSILGDKQLKTIVLVGDGGAMIGLQHLVNAALMNVNLTVVLCNNFLFGMTGGQNSAFSPYEFITQTTPRGNIVPPLDICRIMLDCGAEFVARGLATEQSLGQMIASAINHPGFALVEVVELCTEHALDRNALTGKSLSKILEANNQSLGVLTESGTRSEFSDRYEDKYPRKAPNLDKHIVSPSASHPLSRQVGIVVAGSAGEKVQSAARALCEAAISAGLYCTQKSDNPVTQGSGFSIAEVILSSGEILYTGIDAPDAVVVVSNEGLRELEERHLFDALTPDSILIADTDTESFSSKASTFLYPFRREYGPNKAALRALEYFVKVSGVLPAGTVLS
jgi:pyruvate/2-oxoacid:ferredoxin oxidoreductase beta subunit